VIQGRPEEDASALRNNGTFGVRAAAAREGTSVAMLTIDRPCFMKLSSAGNFTKSKILILKERRIRSVHCGPEIPPSILGYLF
jgi:hypothetical protein